MVELALALFASGDASESPRPAARVVYGVRNQLWRRRVRLIAEDDMRASVTVDPDGCPTEEHEAAGVTVMALVDRALRSGQISDRAARLILLKRVADVTTHEVAEWEGCDPRSVRKCRNRGEAVLKSMGRDLELWDPRATRAIAFGPYDGWTV